jgi:nucleotide-binding universal stress UspA family protein
MNNPFPEMTEFCAAMEHMWNAQRKPAQDLVQATAKLLRSKRLTVITAVGWGNPSSKIIDSATKWGADLIVLGSHGRTGLDRFLVANVANIVLRHAHCSVELVRIPRPVKSLVHIRAVAERKIMRVLLAIDGSKYSEAALQAVLARSRPQDTQVRVLHVLEMIASSGYPIPASRDDRTRAQKLVDRAAKKLKAAGFKADTMLVEGDARAGIVDCAKEWRADLIVLGSHGRTGLKRFLLGSTSEAVGHHAPCSVEVVRLRSLR